MMPLDTEDGAKALQLITSRYDAREWRKKIEKTLSLPPKGMEDEVQRKIFLHLKLELQAYKSRRADAPAWVVGGYGTKEVIEILKGINITKENKTVFINLSHPVEKIMELVRLELAEAQ
jgi:hypothetical protein